MTRAAAATIVLLSSGRHYRVASSACRLMIYRNFGSPRVLRECNRLRGSQSTSTYHGAAPRP